MRKLTLFLIVTWLIVMVIAIPLRAEIRIRDYDKIKESAEFKAYIFGIGVGYSWANTELKNRNQTELYCEPDELALNALNIMDILTREIEVNKNKYTLDTPVALILLVGLQKTFPCGNKQSMK